MYLDYFGLKEAPFSIAPDPRYLFMSERHREALAHLLYGVQGQGGFIVLTGEVGTGKTTICRCFLNQVPSNTDVAFIVNPKLSAHELLASICDEYGIEYERDASIKSLNDALNAYLLDAHAKQRHTVLIIDEAQNLASDVLEQLRLLTNLETSEKKLLQIILLGQPELRDMLAQTELRQLAQRITARYHLQSLNRVELGTYVSCRLAVAGRKPRLFSDKALNRLYKLSGGVPRLINLLSDRALLGAYASNSDQVEVEHIKRANYEILGESRSAWERFVFQYGYRVVGTALGITLFVGLGVWSKPFLDSITPFVDSSVNSVVEVTKYPEKTISHINDQKDEVDVDQSSALQTHALVLKPENGEQVYINDFEEALSSSPESLVAYVEAPNPDTRLLQQVMEKSAPESAGSIPLAAVSVDLGGREKGKKDKLQAFQSLFESWNLNYVEEPFQLACEFAQVNGLACLHKQGNWRSLIRIDRPAVLTLFNNQGQKIHVALLKIEGDFALVEHSGEKFRTSLDDIDRYWLGEYSVIWQLPPYKSGIVTPGQLKEGAWLEKGLAEINPETKDLSLQEQVIEFQRSMGLVPDGIAGSLTLIQMNNLLETDAPKLLGNS
ncbi:MAG: AAA family ATPase [Oleiphilaceae bacterium]|nr:AAA family ATPase [Oleiphilaceae bacterium]